MGNIPTKAEAYELLNKYNKEDFHLLHGKTVSKVMGQFAKEYDSENVEYWEIVGMLHDIDYELYPEEHCVKGEEILKEEGIDDSIIYSAMSHGYGITKTPYEPVKFMEKVLFAIDELTGLIWAAALVRPSKSTKDMEVKSLKKKYKDKKFAGGCSRDTINKGAQLLNWDLDRLLSETLLAMKEIED